MASTRVVRRSALSSDELRALARLVEEVTEHDGVRPLSEHVSLHLRYGGDEQGRNLLGHDERGTLVGYAHLDLTDPVGGPNAELSVLPSARRRGLGRRLVDALLDESGDGRLRLWAHGEHPAAASLASAMGFSGERRLFQLRRSLSAPLPEARLPAGVSVRTFVPGQDEQAWVALNNRAFADHPDQGNQTVADVRTREREPWFDAAGFFLAERPADGARSPGETELGDAGAIHAGAGGGPGVRLVGFHWTKVHPAGTSGSDEPIGEVYVVGVDSAEQGRGLGRALTIVGLDHLRDRGLSQAMLYVDETNVGAVRVYESLGFTRADTDTCFVRESSG
jgi:mycothiol synthase